MDNFKKILNLDGWTPEPAIRSGDTGQRIPCYHSCQMITTLMCDMRVSMGLTDRRKTAKNLVDSRKN